MQCQTTARRPGVDPSMGLIEWYCKVKVEEHQDQTTRPHRRGVVSHTDRWWWASMVLWVASSFSVMTWGFWEIHPKPYKIGVWLFWVLMQILRVYKLLNSHLNPNTKIKTLSLLKFLQKPPWEFKVKMDLEDGSSMEFLLQLALGYSNKVCESSSKASYHLRVNFKDDFQRFQKDEKVKFLL